MKKHTPGPWHVDYDHGMTVRETHGKHQIVVLNKCRKEFAGNAHLISAAPELLQALVMMVEIFGLLEDWSIQSEQDATEMARAAINKAVGGEEPTYDEWARMAETARRAWEEENEY